MRPGTRFTNLGIAFGVGKAGVVEVHEDLSREDGHVGVALDEHLVDVPVGVHLAELLLVVHGPLFVGGIEAGLERVKGFDKGLAEAILAVLLTGIPEASMSIHDECTILH